MKPFLLLLTLGILAACAPRPPEPPPPPLEPKTRPAPATPVPVSATPTPRVFDESLLTGREFLLESPAAQSQLRDIRLGPMETGNIAAVVTALVQSASKGNDPPLDVKTLDPRWAAYLQGWARRMSAEGLSGTVRVGISLPEKDGGIMVPVRVLGEKKEWQGWVYLVKSDSAWLVGDVQLQPRDIDTALYDPESPVLNH